MRSPVKPRSFFRRDGEVFSHIYWFDAAGSSLLVFGFSLWAYLGEYVWAAKFLLICVAGVGAYHFFSGPFQLRIDRKARTITYSWLFGLRKRVFDFSEIEKIDLFKQKQSVRVRFKFGGEKKPRTIARVLVRPDPWDTLSEDILSDVFEATGFRKAEESHGAD